MGLSYLFDDFLDNGHGFNNLDLFNDLNGNGDSSDDFDGLDYFNFLYHGHVLDEFHNFRVFHISVLDFGLSEVEELLEPLLLLEELSVSGTADDGDS